MTKEKLIEVLHQALKSEGAVEVYPDPDSAVEVCGIRLCGNASLERIANRIIEEESLA